MPGAIPHPNSKGTPSVKTFTKKRKCFAIGCPNVEFDTDKRFIYVPEQRARRLRWFLAVGHVKPHNKRAYLCEDHFDVEKDLFYIDGRLKVKKEVTPKTWMPPSMSEVHVKSLQIRRRRKNLKRARRENAEPEGTFPGESLQLRKEPFVLLTRLSSKEVEEATASKFVDSTEQVEIEADPELKRLTETSAPESPLAHAQTPSKTNLILPEPQQVVALHRLPGVASVPVKRKLMIQSPLPTKMSATPPIKKRRVEAHINCGMEDQCEEITIAIHPEFATLSEKISNSRSSVCVEAREGIEEVKPESGPCYSSPVPSDAGIQSSNSNSTENGVTEPPGDAEDTLGLYSGVLSSFKPVKVSIVEVEDLMARYANYEPFSPSPSKLPMPDGDEERDLVEPDGSSEFPIDILGVGVTSVKLEPVCLSTSMDVEPKVGAGKPAESVTSDSGNLKAKTRLQNGGGQVQLPPEAEGILTRRVASAVSGKYLKPKAVTPKTSTPKSKTPVESGCTEGTPKAVTPKTSAPKSKTPLKSGCTEGTPKAVTSETSAPKSETPAESDCTEAASKAETPKTSPPKSETPVESGCTEGTPKAVTPKTSASKSKTPLKSGCTEGTPKAVTPKTSTPKSKTPAESDCTEATSKAVTPKTSSPKSKTAVKSDCTERTPKTVTPKTSAPKSKTPVKSGRNERPSESLAVKLRSGVAVCKGPTKQNFPRQSSEIPIKSRRLSAPGDMAEVYAKKESTPKESQEAKITGARKGSVNGAITKAQTYQPSKSTQPCQLPVKTEDSHKPAAPKPKVQNGTCHESGGSPSMTWSPARRRKSAPAKTSCACCVNSEKSIREPSPVKSPGPHKSGAGLVKVEKTGAEAPKANCRPTHAAQAQKKRQHLRPMPVMLNASIKQEPPPEEQSDKYKCHHCGDPFSSKTRLEIHLALHAPNFTCGKDSPVNAKNKAAGKRDIAGLTSILEARSRKIDRPLCSDPFDDPPTVDNSGNNWHRRKWSPESTLLPIFPFLGTPRAQPPEGRQPLDYFFHFFTPDFLQRTVATTNCHLQALKKKLTDKRVLNIDELTLDELLKFIALAFLHFVYLGGTSDWLEAYGIPVDQILPRDRFELILHILSFSLNDSSDVMDLLVPLVEYFNDRMAKISYPAKNLILDESARVGDDLYYWKSSSNMKYHSSLYTLSEKDGFAQRLCLYRGERNGVGNPVVNYLMNGLYDKGHSLYMNKFLCSVQLVEELIGRRTYCTGALGPQRKVYPPDVKPSVPCDAKGQTNVVAPAENFTRYTKHVCFSKYHSGREYVCVSSEFNGNELRNKDMWTGRYMLRPTLLYQYLCTTTRPPRKNEPPRPKLTLLKGNCANKLACHILAIMMRNSFVLFARQNRTDLNVKDFQWEVIRHLISYPTPVRLSDELSSHLPHPIRVDIGSSGQQPRVMCSGCRCVKSNVFCFKCPSQPNMCSQCYKKGHQNINIEIKS